MVRSGGAGRPIVSHVPLVAISFRCAMVSAGVSRVAAVCWAPELKALITTRSPSVRSVSTAHITTPSPPFSPGCCQVAILVRAEGSAPRRFSLP